MPVIGRANDHSIDIFIVKYFTAVSVCRNFNKLPLASSAIVYPIAVLFTSQSATQSASGFYHGRKISPAHAIDATGNADFI